MALENINYAAMLADMKAKRAALDSSISALETALASGALGQPSDPSFVAENGGSSVSIGSMDLPSGALLGKSVPIAIKLYLEATKRKQSPQEIATAIRDLGVESTSSNFNTIVATTLKRLRISGDVLRFKDGWGLAAWAPPSMRSAMQPSNRAKKSKAKARKKKKPATQKPAATEASPTETSPSPGGIEGVLKSYFEKHPGTPLSAKGVAEILGVKSQTVGLLCAKLAHKGWLEKDPDGKYVRRALVKAS